MMDLMRLPRIIPPFDNNRFSYLNSTFFSYLNPFDFNPSHRVDHSACNLIIDYLVILIWSKTLPSVSICFKVNAFPLVSTIVKECLSETNLTV